MRLTIFPLAPRQPSNRPHLHGSAFRTHPARRRVGSVVEPQIAGAGDRDTHALHGACGQGGRGGMTRPPGPVAGLHGVLGRVWVLPARQPRDAGEEG